MHDHNPGFLRRTTNVKEKLPNKTSSQSTNLTWEELQSLNAGEWFLKVRAALSYILVYVVSRNIPQSQEVLSDFPDRSFPFSVEALRTGDRHSQESDYTLLTSAPQPR